VRGVSTGLVSLSDSHINDTIAIPSLNPNATYRDNSWEEDADGSRWHTEQKSALGNENEGMGRKKQHFMMLLENHFLTATKQLRRCVRISEILYTH
jgi:hypothetical protein